MGPSDLPTLLKHLQPLANHACQEATVDGVVFLPDEDG